MCFCGSHQPRLPPPCVFGGLHDPQKYMVEANVVHVNYVKSYGRRCNPPMCFWVVYVEANYEKKAPKAVLPFKQHALTTPHVMLPARTPPTLPHILSLLDATHITSLLCPLLYSYLHLLYSLLFPSNVLETSLRSSYIFFSSLLLWSNVISSRLFSSILSSSLLFASFMYSIVVFTSILFSSLFSLSLLFSSLLFFSELGTYPLP
jgi:hypothetical protein